MPIDGLRHGDPDAPGLPSTRRRVMRFGWNAQGIITEGVNMTLASPTANTYHSLANGGFMGRFDTAASNLSSIGPLTSGNFIPVVLEPAFWVLCRTGSVITSQLLWISLAGASVDANPSPSGLHAGFRYDSDTDAGTWRAYSRTSTGAPTVSDTTVPFTADTTYRLGCEVTADSVVFSINGAVCMVHTTNVPSVGALDNDVVALYMRQTTRTNAARSIYLARGEISYRQA